jgi:ABC transporter, phosphonate, periplasmic substrate-binding protein
MHLLLVAALARAVLAAAPAPLTIVACAPGYPGTGAEAQPRMDALATAASQAAGWRAGSLAAVYEPSERGGVARLRARDAAAALVPLPFWVEHGAELKLVPRMQVVAAGGEASEVWTLVAKKGRVPRPDALAGMTIQSTAGYAPGFVRAALAGFGPIPATAHILHTSQVLSALRRAATGADVAVLLDGAQSAALASLPFAGDLEVVARTRPLPGSFLAAVDAHAPAARLRELERGLASLGSSPDGAQALEGLQIARFVPADPAAVEAARRLQASAARASR